MSESELLETQVPRTPAARHRAADEALPEDLLREAMDRLGLLALVWAGLFAVGIVMNDIVAPLLPLQMRDLIPWGRPADVVAILSIGVSLWLWRYTRKLTCRPSLALTLPCLRGAARVRHRHRRPVGAAPRAGGAALVDLRPGAAVSDAAAEYPQEDTHRLAGRRVHGSRRTPDRPHPRARAADVRRAGLELSPQLRMRVDRRHPLQDHGAARAPGPAGPGAGQLPPRRG